MATEKRLIDANALIASGYDVTLDKVFPNWWELPDSTKEAVCEHGQYLKKLINELPTVDAVEVIRCKDCVHWYEPDGVCLKIYSDGAVSPYAWQDRNEDDFCSYGERRTDG